MEFVDFNLAKKLNEKGFNWDRITTYNTMTKVRNNHLEPTISQVLKWLREDKQIHVGIIFTGRDYTTWIQPLNDIDTQITIHDCDNNNEAAIAGIEYVLDNLI